MKDNLNVLIVEDEVLIGETIGLYIEERGHNYLDIVVSYEEAIEAIQTLNPDIVLIDVRLYGQKSGIDVAEYMNSNTPDIPYVFLTSQYDKRIVENAMNTNPLGYLTKPITKETLWTTLEVAFNKSEELNQNVNKIEVNDGAKIHLINEDEITFILSDHVYIKINLTNNRVITARLTLQEFNENLSIDKFIQCHRGYIINKAHVSSFDNNNILIDGNKIPISRNRKKEVLEFINR